MSDALQIDIEDHVAHVVLNRPDKINALNRDLFTGLVDAADRLSVDPDVRAVVLSGAGRGFSSGLDTAFLAEMASGELSADGEQIQDAIENASPSGANFGQQPGWKWQECPVPVIAAVHGVAMGGGLHVALGADIRYVTPDARLALPEVTWGLVPDMSATQSLRRLVPLDLAKEIVLSGREFSGTEAVAMGVATHLSDDPVSDALGLARAMARNSPDAVRAAKTLLNASALVPVPDGLALEMQLSGGLMGKPNQIEAVMARFDKRDPEFSPPERLGRIRWWS